MAGAGGGGAAGGVCAVLLSADAFISRREPSGRRNVIHTPSRIFLSSLHILGRPLLALFPACDPPGRHGTAPPGTRQLAGCMNGLRGVGFRAPASLHAPLLLAGGVCSACSTYRGAQQCQGASGGNSYRNALSFRHQNLEVKFSPP